MPNANYSHSMLVPYTESKWNDEVTWSDPRPKPTWAQLLAEWDQYKSGYGGTLLTELVFDGTNWNQAQQVRVRFADGKLPTYLELDALVIDPNQTYTQIPRTLNMGHLTMG